MPIHVLLFHLNSLVGLPTLATTPPPVRPASVDILLPVVALCYHYLQTLATITKKLYGVVAVMSLDRDHQFAQHGVCCEVVVRLPA